MSSIDRRDRPFGQVDMAYATVLSTTPPDDDGPVWMVNLMRYRDQAVYADGRETTLTGREADDVYAPVEILDDLGAEVAFFGDVTHQLAGDTPIWDRVGVVLYPTRRSFIDMQSRPDFVEKYAHKEAGMAETIIIGTQPIDVPAASDPAADGSDEADPADAVIVVDVIRFADGTDADPDARAARPPAASVDGWFAAEGTIIGDGRSWDQVRYHVFPSLEAATAAHAPDPAIADRYAVVVRPLIDRISGYSR